MIASVLFLVPLYTLTALCAPPSRNESRPTVTIKDGVVAGRATLLPPSKVTVNQFLGVPFAAPPVRFSSPQPPTPWPSVYDASNYKPACIQKFDYPEASRNATIRWANTPPPPAGESEDCLNLNIFAPESAPEGSRPVLFWIYGGGFAFGAGSLPLYDGTSFAANQDVVVVTINYRTNVFGFPGSPDLPEAERNLGLLDQRLALDWVQKNIAAFGGDPNKVTIMGESAGAMSVDSLITNPQHPLPFRAAILQSGVSTIQANSNDSATSWDALVKQTKCPPEHALDCLRAIPAHRLKNLVERMALGFTPDPDGGATWPESPRQKRLNSTEEASRIARVPILIGSNADEGQTFILGVNVTDSLLGALLGVQSPELLKALLEAYPLGSPGIRNERDRVAKVLTDYAFQCPTKIVAEESKAVGIDAWRYYYNASFPNAELYPGSGAYHAAEISIIFGTYPQKGATRLQKSLSQVMQKAWADFAKSPSSGPGWQSVPRVAIFGHGNATTVDAKRLDMRCELYQDLYDAVSIR